MKLTLVGTGITLPHVDETALRYNLANAHLEAYVRDHPDTGSAVDVDRFDLQYSLDALRFDEGDVARVVASKPDVLGLSCYSWDIDAQLDLAAAVRRAHPSVRVVLGGPSASFQARELLEANPAVDAAVRGEGEQALVELLGADWRDLQGLSGLTWRDPDGVIREEADRPAVRDLTGLPSPLLSGVLEPPKQNLMLEFSRGCRYRCKYCAWMIGGGAVRYVSEERVRGEIRWALERNYEHAFIIDSAINNHDERLEIVARAARELDPNQDLAYSYFVNYDFVTPYQAKLMGDLRAHEINVGLETTNPAALDAAGRHHIDEDAFSRALDLVRDGVGPATLHLMLGMPGDDLAGFRRTLDFVARQAERPGGERVRGVRVHWMLIAPGSVVWKRADEYGITVNRDGVPYVLGSETFPQKDLIQALHVLREHPRSDLFIWEDAEPLKLLGEDVPEMFLAGGDHIGGRAPVPIEDGAVLAAIAPLAPGRPLRRGWSVGELERQSGWPIVTLRGPGARAVRVQFRPRDAEPNPMVRTGKFDLVWLPTEGSDVDPREEQALVGALTQLVLRNDPPGSVA